ncbi:MAG: hypothetical protein KDA30_04420 [Phycisphaerales bacterium]|nr:hypothetical protein [Phycisphaerales bacterium]
MRTLIRIIIASAALFFLTACVSSNYMAIGDQTYPPRADDYVIDVYLPTDAPVNVHQSVANSKPLASLPSYAREIGRIDTEGAPAASWSSVINDAKKKARALGGDALVIKQWGSYLSGVDGYGTAYHGKNLSMTVVRYRP